MESAASNNSFLDEAKRMEQALAAWRRIATATRPELRQALDDYLAVIDGLGIADSPRQQGQEPIANLTSAVKGDSD
jgi:hypothetical protein